MVGKIDSTDGKNDKKDIFKKNAIKKYCHVLNF